MPSKSKAQQALFAATLHNPGSLSPQNASLADLPKQTLHEFAATKVTKLPEHVAKGHPHQNLGKYLHAPKKGK